MWVRPWVRDCVNSGHFFGTALHDTLGSIGVLERYLCIGIEHFLLLEVDTHSIVERLSLRRQQALVRLCTLSASLSQDCAAKYLEVGLIAGSST